MPRWLLLAAACITFVINGSALAQQPSETDAVKAANQAFYTALSARDLGAMQKVWSSDPEIQNIGPANTTITVGWENIKKGFEGTFDRFPDLKASQKELRIKIVGAVAWVSGVEDVERKDKSGAASRGANFGTNIFQKQDGRWVMVYHHASVIPQ